MKTLFMKKPCPLLFKMGIEMLKKMPEEQSRFFKNLPEGEIFKLESSINAGKLERFHKVSSYIKFALLDEVKHIRAVAPTDREAVFETAYLLNNNDPAFLNKFLLSRHPDTQKRDIQQLRARGVPITSFPAERSKVIGFLEYENEELESVMRRTGASIEFDGFHTAVVSSPDIGSMNVALRAIRPYFEELKQGKLYIGTIERITDSAVIIRIPPDRVGELRFSDIKPKLNIEEIKRKFIPGEEMIVKAKIILGKEKLFFSIPNLTEQEKRTFHAEKDK